MTTNRQLFISLFLIMPLLFICHATASASQVLEAEEIKKTEVAEATGEAAVDGKAEVAEVDGEAEATGEEKDQLSFEEKWGIKVLGIRTTAAGFMLNFRYKIVNAEKVAAFMGPRTKPYLIHQATGYIFKVPQMAKVGALYQRMNKAYPDRIYFALFDNPNMLAQPGSKVTVVIGDCKIKDLVVQ